MTYIEIDEQKDVLASLELIELALSQCVDNSNLWKWVVIALHNAVQGAAVCHLSDTAQLGALTNKAQKEWLKWYDGRMIGNEPKSYLEAPVKLLQKVKAGKSGSSICFTGQVKITDDQLNDFKCLNDLRNQFVHFKPTSWSIGISGMPRIIRSQMKIVEDIFVAGWAFRHLDTARRAAFQSFTAKICSAPVLDTFHECRTSSDEDN